MLIGIMNQCLTNSFSIFFQIVRENNKKYWNYFLYQDLFFRIISHKIVGKYYLSLLNLWQKL